METYFNIIIEKKIVIENICCTLFNVRLYFFLKIAERERKRERKREREREQLLLIYD